MGPRGGDVETASARRRRAAQPNEAPRTARNARIRAVAVIAVLIVVLIVSKATGFADSIDRDRIRAWLLSAGPVAVPAFALAFAVGELFHVPGLVFVAAAVFTYGRGYGLLVSYFSALFSVAFGFTVTRCMNGGVTIEQLELPVPRGCERCCRCLNWTVERLKVAPIRSVACLRLVFFLSPQLNSGLAFTGVKFAPYMAGSALGIPAQLVLAVFLLDFLLEATVRRRRRRRRRSAEHFPLPACAVPSRARANTQ